MANLTIYLKDGTTRTAETDILNYLEGDTRQPANRLLWLDADTQQKQVVRIEDIKRFTVDVSGEGEGIAGLVNAAKEISGAASALKELESSQLEPKALADAWGSAYDRLYQANAVLARLLGGDDGNT